MNLDKTFCASPNCKNECGRQWTKEHDKAMEQAQKPYISVAFFCGLPETKKDKCTELGNE